MSGPALGKQAVCYSKCNLNHLYVVHTVCTLEVNSSRADLGAIVPTHRFVRALSQYQINYTSEYTFCIF